MAAPSAWPKPGQARERIRVHHGPAVWFSPDAALFFPLPLLLITSTTLDKLLSLSRPLCRETAAAANPFP